MAGIIREEDLDRIDKIRNEDWVRGEEIDYNQKLVFSDDENEVKETAAPTKGNNHNKRKEQEIIEARKSEERLGKSINQPNFEINHKSHRTYSLFCNCSSNP